MHVGAIVFTDFYRPIYLLIALPPSPEEFRRVHSKDQFRKMTDPDNVTLKRIINLNGSK